MTAPPDQGGLADSDQFAEPSTTARLMRRLRVALVVGCVLTGAVCLLAFSQAHLAVGTIRHRAAPAVLQAQAAYWALADADRAAMDGVHSDTSALGGPGGQYENDISAVDQSLEQVAADNVAGPDGSSQLRLVQGLVVTYNAEIGQADADFEHGASPELVATDLWNAWYTLNPTLADLRDLRTEESTALSAQRGSVWLAGAAPLVWALPVLLLLALFRVTHVVVRRRFRRRLSLRLAAAVLSLAAMSLLCGLSLLAYDDHLDSAFRNPYAATVALADSQAGRISASGEADLYSLVKAVCPAADHGCGTTITPGTALSPAEVTALVGTMHHERSTDQAAFDHGLASADTAYALRFALVAVLAVLAAALTAFGLRPRIDEYRFEVR